MIKLFFKWFSAGLIISLIIIACSKSNSGGNPSPPNPCSNVNINLTATATDAAACQNNGTINATATGSTGFTYSINGTTFQSSGSFASVAPGTITVTVKDVNGCTKTTSVTVGSAGVAGPKFTAVKALMQANCQSCHNNTIANGGMNWTVDCNIVVNNGRIKVRAVDEGTMPPTGPLSQSDKNKITDWINAGGRFTD
ncbi:MAG: c-type cytochrome [Chitinophagaceae bacterium]